ncbi:MAG TPA: nucleotidyltransferase domain-containing protein [Ktedonobacteraceae bacterium]|jgi:predicted nucleotidyltransferase
MCDTICGRRGSRLSLEIETGSYAKGTAHAGSDVDLLIVEASPLPRLQRGKAVRAALGSFPCHFDLLFFTPRELADEMRNSYSFLSSVMAGVRLV